MERAAGTKRSREVEGDLSIEYPAEKRSKFEDQEEAHTPSPLANNNNEDNVNFEVDSEVVDCEDSRDDGFGLEADSTVAAAFEADSTVAAFEADSTVAFEADSTVAAFEDELERDQEVVLVAAEEDEDEGGEDEDEDEADGDENEDKEEVGNNIVPAGDPRDFMEDIGRTQYRIPIDRFTLARENDSWPNGEYLYNRAVTLENRRELIIWMAEAMAHFRCHSETHMLAFSIMHRYLNLTPDLPLGRLQLAGLAVLFLALKFAEQPPYLREFVEALLPTNRDISPDDVLEMEKEILGTIDWDLTCPLPLHFLVGFWDSVDPPAVFSKRQAWFLSLYAAELMMGEACLLRYTPSTVAASAVYVVRLLAAFHQPQTHLWTPQLQEITRKSTNDLEPCVQEMLHLLHQEARYLQNHDDALVSPATLAYSRARYEAVSVIMARIILCWRVREGGRPRP